MKSRNMENKIQKLERYRKEENAKFEVLILTYIELEPKTRNIHTKSKTNNDNKDEEYSLTNKT